ncbi:helix-turn-helix transcriptional regulator [Amycolatopsis sp. NPDC024027]|uniref:ATP-binding protein n=1 Tax=Amycolatopsis sp. NPDC024027 TaxID=3154327 RepID=UPI0033FDF50D
MGDQDCASLRRYRQRAALTQEELAERSGVSVRTIRGLENGTRRNPQLDSLRRLADAVNLSTEEREELVASALGLGPQTAPPPSLPRQLPALLQGFTGRDTELTALTAGLDTVVGTSETIMITVVAGPGGIGKTALVVRWAHQHADRFPDGQLFVDLCGFSPNSNPVGALAALRGFLDALGIDPAGISGGLAEHAARYRSHVAGKRMLIVLDNAATTDQVIPLLPGTPTCTVLVTSRNTLTALLHRHGARHLTLTVFDDDEAHALLARRLGNERVAAEPDAVTDLVMLCGRYPLALAIVAARAHAAGADIPLAEFTAELREPGLDALDDNDPTASLPAVLSVSLRDLTAQQSTLFALLGVTPGPDISLPAAASLIGLSIPRTRAVLRVLVDGSLLDRGPAERYGMHDLVRDYAGATADRQLTADNRAAALRRVADFYTHTAQAAANQLLPHRPMIVYAHPAPGSHLHYLGDARAATAWFDQEYANLIAAQHMAIDRHWHDTVWTLAWALTSVHLPRGRLRDELEVWKAGAQAAAHLPDPAAQIFAYRHLGRACVELAHHQEAADHLHKALDLARRHRERIEEAHTHRVIARALTLRGDDRNALDHVTCAVNLYRDLAQPVWEADALNQMGWFAASLGDYDAARAHCQAALDLHQQHQNTEGEANTLDSLGYLAHQTGCHAEAIAHYQQALDLYRGLGNTSDYANTLDRLARSHLAIGRHDHARAAWQEALHLFRQQRRDEKAARVQQDLDAVGWRR